MAAVKTASVKTIIAWGNGWNPTVKLVTVAADGHRYFTVTRLHAAVTLAQAAIKQGKTAEITYQRHTHAHIYRVTGWDEQKS